MDGNRPQKLSPITLKVRYRGAILGTAIGDALGAPIEAMEKSDIIPQLPSGDDFIDPNDIKRPVGIRQNVYHKGDTTDDTQQMKPILWSIINKNAIDPLEIAEFTRRVYDNEELRGWSKSVKSACDRLNNKVPWFRASELSIGVGNGIAMKAAPLGLYLSKLSPGSPEWRHAIYSIIGVGKITHHELGIIAGVLQSCLIAMQVNGFRNKSKIISNLSYVEKEFFNSSRFTDKLKMAMKFSSIADIAKNFGVSPKADRSWVTTTAVFLQTELRSEALLNLFKLIQEGGDCDTTGSMFGALIGAKYGASVFPMHLRKEVEANKELMKLADNMFNKVELGELVPKINMYEDE